MDDSTAAAPPLPAAPRRAFLRRALVPTLVPALVPTLVTAFGLTASGTARAAHQVKPWPAGVPAPALALADLDGTAWRLDALKGQPVLVNFWATWCAPCRAEMPTLQQLAARHAAAGLVVLTVNYKEPAATIRRFTETLPAMRLPVLLDPDGAATSAWTPRVFPSSVLIGRDGRPRQTVIGELNWLGPEAQPLVAALLTSPKPARTA